MTKTNFLTQERYIVTSPGQLTGLQKWLGPKRIEEIRLDMSDAKGNPMIGLRSVDLDTGKKHPSGLIIVLKQSHPNKEEQERRTQMLLESAVQIVYESRDNMEFFDGGGVNSLRASGSAPPLAEDPALKEAAARLEESKRRTLRVIRELPSSQKLTLWALRELGGKASVDEVSSFLNARELGVPNISSPLSNLKKAGLVTNPSRAVWAVVPTCLEALK